MQLLLVFMRARKGACGRVKLLWRGTAPPILMRAWCWEGRRAAGTTCCCSGGAAVEEEEDEELWAGKPKHGEPVSGCWLLW